MDRLDPNRRNFLKAVALISALGPVTLLEDACSNVSPTGFNQGPQPTGTLDVSLSAHPSLANDNTVVTIQVPQSVSIFMTHTTGDSYFALSRICTHQGCTVSATTPTLDCPCHGSAFSLTGSVVQGPAGRALQSWPVSLNGDTLTIDFG